ncbi:MAG: hypothetical protein ACHQ9S_27190 [Candidatus Binatia bacterium]
MSLLIDIVGVLFLIGWFGFLGVLVWSGLKEVHADLVPADPLRPPAWSRAEKWVVGLGTVFLVIVVLDRLTGSSDADFFTGVIWLVGSLAVLAWVFTGFGAVAILVWRAALYVRRRRATRA